MKCGRAFVHGGFRPVVVKRGRKWTHIVFQDGYRIRVERVLDEVRVEPIEGYDIADFAGRWLNPEVNSLGTPIKLTAGAKRILQEAGA